MLESRVRPKIQPVFDAAASFLIACRCTPLIMTGMAFASGLTAALFLAHGYWISALSFMWFSGLCDGLDGTLARLLKRVDAWGAYNDLISDRLVESAIILAFAFWQPAYGKAYLVFMIALLFHFSTFLAAGALFKNHGPKSMHYDHSFIERAEAFIVFSFMMIFPTSINWLMSLLNAAVFLMGFTRYVRVKQYAYTKVSRLCIALFGIGLAV